MLFFVVNFIFFNDTATTEIYTLSLHDRSSDLAGPGPAGRRPQRRRRTGLQAARRRPPDRRRPGDRGPRLAQDRKSTRLNSSHANISYAVFCLKKKNRNFSLSALYDHNTAFRLI